jgi:hypothetical protein
MALRLLFIDTDADVGPYSFNRLLGQGDFVSQLTRLREMLPHVEAAEIRVLVMHHSLMPPQPEGEALPPRKRIPRVLEITPGSRRVLDRLLVELNIRVVLTGHLHVPRLSIISVSNGTERSSILEARCGTTTQRDRYPDEIYSRVAPDRQLPPNTLIVHKIIETNGSSIWRSEIFWLNRLCKFVNGSNYATRFLPSQLKTEIQLLKPAR